jgi:PhnB protein
MSKVTLEPYLFFKGNCREAMEYYKEVFGGKLDINEVDMKDFEGYDMPNKEWFKGKIMHCSLKGGDVNLMASDTPKASPKTAKVELSLGGTDEAHMRKIFENLAEGGKVTQPLKKQFWGDVFGQLTDKYGVDWMMNIGKGM